MERPGKIVAIHQPNFFPWLGYFDKIARCDVFVLLDNVQIPRTGAGSWVNRVHVLIGGKVQWLTLPIDKASGGLRAINEVRIAPDERARRKLIDTMRHQYRKAPHYDEVFPVLEPLLRNPETNLAEYNIRALTTLAVGMGFRESMFVRSSSLPSADEVSTDRLVALVNEVGGSAYLYGGGAVDYQQNERFEQAGLGVMAQGFCHPSYKQFNTAEFVPGLSVIDALMNLGFAGTAELLSGI